MHSREAWARKLPEASCDLKSTLAALLFLAATLPASAIAQEPVLELDHVFIVVPPGGAEAIEALRQSGITVDTEVIRHEGQGTASVSALFENAYIELLWVDSSVAVDSAHYLDIIAFRRAAAWRETGSSPFGIGLHLLSGDASDLRVPYHLLSISGTQLNYVRRARGRPGRRAEPRTSPMRSRPLTLLLPALAAWLAACGGDAPPAERPAETAAPAPSADPAAPSGTTPSASPPATAPEASGTGGSPGCRCLVRSASPGSTFDWLSSSSTAVRQC